MLHWCDGVCSAGSHNMYRHICNSIIMRPSSLGGGRILRRTLSVCLSVRPVIIAIGNVFSSTASVTDVLFGTHLGHPYFSARTEGRISYGHLGRTNSCLLTISPRRAVCRRQLRFLFSKWDILFLCESTQLDVGNEILCDTMLFQ